MCSTHVQGVLKLVNRSVKHEYDVKSLEVTLLLSCHNISTILCSFAFHYVRIKGADILFQKINTTLLSSYLFDMTSE